jgi:hypothetical protein
VGGAHVVPNMTSVKLGTCTYIWGTLVHFSHSFIIIPSFSPIIRTLLLPSPYMYLERFGACGKPVTWNWVEEAVVRPMSY